MSNKPNRQRSSGIPAASPISPAAASSAVNRKLLLIALVAAIAVVAAIVVAVVVTGGDDEPEATEQPLIQPALDFGEVTITGELLPEVNDRTGVTAADSFGLAAPVVSGTDYFGFPITIDASVDGPTLVVLLAHWCHVCNDEVPQLNIWRDSGDVPEWLNVIGVGTAASADNPNFPPGIWLQEMDWQWPVLADVDFATDYPGSATRAYGAGGYPGFVLIDGSGTVVWKHNGAVGLDDLNAVIAAAFPDGPGTVAAAPATTAAADTTAVADTTDADATTAGTAADTTAAPATTVAE